MVQTLQLNLYLSHKLHTANLCIARHLVVKFSTKHNLPSESGTLLLGTASSSSSWGAALLTQKLFSELTIII